MSDGLAAMRLAKADPATLAAHRGDRHAVATS
jgi:hypothetical protein